MADGLRVPLITHPGVQIGLHRGEARRLRRIGSQVALFERIARQIVELRRYTQGS